MKIFLQECIARSVNVICYQIYNYYIKLIADFLILLVLK